MTPEARPREILPILRAAASYLNGPCRLPRLRPLLVALLSLAFVLQATPASADTGAGMPGANISMGTLSLGYVTPTDAWSLVSSTYNLSDVDLLTHTFTGQELGDSLSADYATQVDLASQAQLAVDAANLARQAQIQAEMRRLQALTATSRLKEGAVPEQYRALVESAVAQYCPRLPVGVFAAQIEAESNWNPRAGSSAGAQGIAQFMPGTWAGAGLDANGDGVANVWDPEDAIPAAAKYDCAMLAAVDDIPGDPIANMLAAYNAGAGAVRQYGGVPPYSETQGYVSKILTRADQLVTYSSNTGPEGCPTNAPAGTLRRGATSYSISQICADSVAQARTPEAGAAIKYALAQLGDIYSQPRRNDEGYYDCSSLVGRAYQAAGVNISPPGQNAPTTVTFRSATWSHRIPYSQVMPGDWVQPTSGHMYMVLSHNLMVQAPQTGDVVHVSTQYSTSPYAAGWVDPALA